MLRLASSSPRRRELLALLGVAFETTPAALDESAHPSPALAKAEHAASAGSVTLAADTLIELDGERIGKPADVAEAAATLRRLRGRTHLVRTEVATIDARGVSTVFAVRSQVRLEGTDGAVDRYVATGEPLDKAGGYAIQGEGGQLVGEWRGCLANVVGLPLCHAYFALRRAGVVTKQRPEIVCQERFAFRCQVWRAAHRQGRALRNHADFASWDEAVDT